MRAGRVRAIADCYTAEQLHGASLISGYHDAVPGIAQDSFGEFGLYSFVVAGGLILAFWYFWTLFRCIKGLLLLTRNQVPSTAGNLGIHQGTV